jgi:hypothetical protein
MMARVLVAKQAWGVQFRTVGDKVLAWQQLVCSIDTTAYAASTGSTPVASFITNDAGELPGWVEEGGPYALTVNGTTTDVWTTTGGRTDSLESSNAGKADKANLAVNIKDYGAVGDASTNDTAAYNAAVTAAPVGGTVFFPDGTYMVDNGRLVTKALTFAGASRKGSVLKNRSTDGGRFIWVQADDVTYTNMTVHGNRSAQSANTGGTIVWSGPTAPLATVNNAAVIGCDIYGCGFDAIGAVNVRGGRFIGNGIFDCYDTGFDVVEGSRQIVIQGNYVKTSASFGIGLDSDDRGTYGDVRDCTVSGNTVIVENGALASYGILVQSAVRITVTGNTVDMTAATLGVAGIRVDSHAQLVSVVGNTVLGTSANNAAGISVDGQSTGQEQPDKLLTIAANTISGFTGTGAAGIYIYLANRVTISGNVVVGNKRGINVEITSVAGGAGIVVSGNQATDNTDIGIRFAAPSGSATVVVTDNHVVSNTNYNYAWDAAWTILYSGAAMAGTNFQGSVPKLSFFTATAVAKPTGVAVTAAGIHAALVTLGLIAA